MFSQGRRSPTGGTQRSAFSSLSSWSAFGRKSPHRNVTVAFSKLRFTNDAHSPNGSSSPKGLCENEVKPSVFSQEIHTASNVIVSPTPIYLPVSFDQLDSDFKRDPSFQLSTDQILETTQEAYKAKSDIVFNILKMYWWITDNNKRIGEIVKGLKNIMKFYSSSLNTLNVVYQKESTDLELPKRDYRGAQIKLMTYSKILILLTKEIQEFQKRFM